jgi:hypothetical protein
MLALVLQDLKVNKLLEVLTSSLGSSDFSSPFYSFMDGRPTEEIHFWFAITFTRMLYLYFRCSGMDFFQLSLDKISMRLGSINFITSTFHQHP